MPSSEESRISLGPSVAQQNRAHERLMRRLEKQKALKDKQVAEGSQADRFRSAIVRALEHLDYATPTQRNGPCHQAINELRTALKLPTMSIGGRALEGFADEETG